MNMLALVTDTRQCDEWTVRMDGISGVSSLTSINDMHIATDSREVICIWVTRLFIALVQ